MNAYYVEAQWGQDDEGTYATFLWAKNRDDAERACMAEMNRHDLQSGQEGAEEYDILAVVPLQEHMEWLQSQASDARDFLSKGSNKCDDCDDCGNPTDDDAINCPDGAHICQSCFDMGGH